MKPQVRCDGVSRRELIRVGGLSALGLGLGQFLSLRKSCAGEKPSTPRAKSCILIWLDGGPSHLETFDPKPEAPEEVRGPLGTVATNLAGIRLSECLERTAGMMDKLAVIRSMTSPLGEHNFGTHYLMTGYKPSPALVYPTMGATVAQTQLSSKLLPANIAIPNLSPNVSGHGYLPPATAPFEVGGNPASPGFKVRDLDFYQGLNLERIDRRREIVRAFDQFSRIADANPLAADPTLEQAYNLIASADAKTAFNLFDESAAVRERYGRSGANGLGQSCLLARRLVERGVPFVTVTSNGWDTHQNILQLKERYPNDRNAHLPTLDRALSALIEDLSERGMLDETLVVVMGEFGRTPKVNTSGGRDHWPNVFSVALAGGGVQGGQILGSSDPLGELPKERPVSPSDLAATLYSLLGIDPAGELHTSDGRPVRITPDGSSVISEIIG